MKIAVVIPCYKVKERVLAVVSAIGPSVSVIYAVDDCCPEGTGDFLAKHCPDPRLKILRNETNLGVGGATITGYRAALEDFCDVVVKLDGDGQMDPRLIPSFVTPIVHGKADYTKGNRFFALELLQAMPRLRVAGNAVLSFMTKASSGYWDIMDPTNGYTAIHADVLRRLPLDKLDKRFFFESDMLFRLNTLRAVVWDIPMQAAYGGETSNLRIGAVTLRFPLLHAARLAKRIFYNYFLRDFNLCSLQLVCGLLLWTGAGAFGAYHWYLSWATNVPAKTGTVIIAALGVILGFQLLLAAASYDVENVPRTVLRVRGAE